MKLSLLLLVALSFMCSISFANQNNTLQIKALFLYNFANFVEWPASAFQSKNSPIELCLYGDVPFSKFLNAIDGTLIGERALMINSYKDKRVFSKKCQMLFVGNDKIHEIKDFESQKKFLYILSIGESDGFIDQGGTINIMRNSDSYTFDINLTSATKNGLFISSDLLILARKVTGNN